MNNYSVDRKSGRIPRLKRGARMVQGILFFARGKKYGFVSRGPAGGLRGCGVRARRVSLAAPRASSGRGRGVSLARYR